MTLTAINTLEQKGAELPIEYFGNSADLSILKRNVTFPSGLSGSCSTSNSTTLYQPKWINNTTSEGIYYDSDSNKIKRCKTSSVVASQDTTIGASYYGTLSNTDMATLQEMFQYLVGVTFYYTTYISQITIYVKLGDSHFARVAVMGSYSSSKNTFTTTSISVQPQISCTTSARGNYDGKLKGTVIATLLFYDSSFCTNFYAIDESNGDMPSTYKQILSLSS